MVSVSFSTEMPSLSQSSFLSALPLPAEEVLEFVEKSLKLKLEARMLKLLLLSMLPSQLVNISIKELG